MYNFHKNKEVRCNPPPPPPNHIHNFDKSKFRHVAYFLIKASKTTMKQDCVRN